MIPIFIQTLNHVFDVSKITFIDIKPRGSGTVHFLGGDKVILLADELESLLDSVAGLRPSGKLVAIQSEHGKAV